MQEFEDEPIVPDPVYMMDVYGGSSCFSLILLSHLTAPHPLPCCSFVAPLQATSEYLIISHHGVFVC